MTVVEDVLGRIGRSGAFAVKLDAKAEDLHLEVKGVGRVAFPISKARAAALCRVAKPARHGFKDQTVLDTAVRDTWEIAKSKIKIDEGRWKSALSSALERIARGLGLGPGAKLRASLHNLLVYGNRRTSFFRYGRSGRHIAQESGAARIGLIESVSLSSPQRSVG